MASKRGRGVLSPEAAKRVGARSGDAVDFEAVTTDDGKTRALNVSNGSGFIAGPRIGIDIGPEGIVDVTYYEEASDEA